MSAPEQPQGILLTNAKTPRSPEEVRRQKWVDRELRRLAKARRNRIKHHPCPTCETSGHIRRSFGFAYPGDPQSETFMFIPCPTCDRDGALPPGRTPARLRAGERAATLAEAFPDLYPEPVTSADAGWDAEDVDLEAVAEQVGLEVDELIEALGGLADSVERTLLEGTSPTAEEPRGLLGSAEGRA
jgi:hypothetical protein